MSTIIFFEMFVKRRSQLKSINQKNSKRVQQFVECFGVQLVVTNHSTVIGVVVIGCH